MTVTPSVVVPVVSLAASLLSLLHLLLVSIAFPPLAVLKFLPSL